MQVLLLKLTESTCGCCEMLLATECRGFHAVERGDRVSMVGSPHRPALSRSAKRLGPCVRPGLGEKGHIIAPWPVPLCSPVDNILTTRKCHGCFFFFFFLIPPRGFSFIITQLSWANHGSFFSRCTFASISLHPNSHPKLSDKTICVANPLTIWFKYLPWYVIPGGFT